MEVTKKDRIAYIVDNAEYLEFYRQMWWITEEGKVEKDNKIFPSSLINKSLSSTIMIRPETAEKIKQLLKDDMMETCEINGTQIYQEYAVSGKWKEVLKNDNKTTH